MAALYPDTLNRRILVKKVPFKTNHDKLFIYFQKKKHGGCGDVASITFPKSNLELDQAVVEFEEHETMKSLLLHQPHIFDGQQIDVTEFPEQAFGNTTVVISDVVQTKLQQLPESEIIFLQESTGVLVTTDNDKICISGHWYQVNAAADRIETLIDDSTNTVAIAQNATSGSIIQDWYQVNAAADRIETLIDDSTNTVASAQNATSLSIIQNSQNITGPRKDEEIPVEVEINNNIYALMKRSCPSFMQTLSKKYKVLLDEDDSKVVFNNIRKNAPPKASDSKEAAKSFEQRYSKFTTQVVKQNFDLKKMHSSPSQKKIDEAVDVMMGRNKNIFISKGKNINKMVFLALSKKCCENAIDEFKCMFLKRKILSSFTLDRTNTKIVMILGDFRKEKSEALLSEIDSLKGGMVVSAGGESVKKALESWHSIKPNHHPVDNKNGKCNLQCDSIIHYVLDPLGSEIDLESSIASCLEFANQRGVKTLTLPMNSLGVGLDDKTVSESVFNAILELAARSFLPGKELRLIEIRIIHSDDKKAQNLVKSASVLAAVAQSNEDSGSASGAKPNRKNSSKDKTEEEKEVCAVCLDDLYGATPNRTLLCKHTFHTVCIDKALSVSKKCPMCMRFYGRPTGDMPRGNMQSRTIYSRLPGFDCETICIEYNIPSGTQGPEHPNPGRSFSGARRTAYLPNNTEGREILLLLRKAFDARQTFTIGQSVTTGQTNCVTWNDIHHKTNMHGGSTGFGYPDPGYLTRLKQELADKGITN